MYQVSHTYAATGFAPPPQVPSLLLISFRNGVLYIERASQRNILSGIESAIIWLAAQCLNQLRHSVLSLAQPTLHTYLFWSAVSLVFLLYTSSCKPDCLTL